ncbi:hypothetical protein JKA74_11410 [Marivirga sp. S37H4]|uniref:Uncharacterized protein n=1 Tax=Marivirga aurantiaca TaxID=2802615 RepID=A0A935C9K3_9BACT|nr:hypothetical protein [Marivirga aurantiaca]MBK6265647.1 hypothetical protein [Marivirga aurantiaca]
MSKKNSIVIHNIKNSNFRQIHVDGAHGGITPSGFINLNFYSQRGVIPKGTEFAIDESGKISEAIRDIEGSKSGIVREFELGVYMDINTCTNLKDFLEKKIEEYNKLTEGKNK